MPAVGEDPEGDLDEVPDEGGHGEEGTDLGVREPEVGADAGEGGVERAVDELVEQLEAEGYDPIIRETEQKQAVGAGREA